MTRFSRRSAFTLALAMGIASLAAVAQASTAQTSPETTASASWTTEQLVTSTVHDAWLLSGKDETKFFEMVKTLAELSAEKRGLALPNSEEAGRRMGAAIKRMANADTDQLLYVVVDKAVVYAAHGGPHAAGSGRAKAPAPEQ